MVQSAWAHLVGWVLGKQEWGEATSTPFVANSCEALEVVVSWFIPKLDQYVVE